MFLKGEKIVSISSALENKLSMLGDNVLKEAAEYHPMFAEYMGVIDLLYVYSSMIYELPELKKHRKLPRMLRKTYRVGSLSSPVLDSYFDMWEFFDVEIGNSGETVADFLIQMSEKMGLIEEKLTLLEVLKESMNSIYSCEKLSNDRAVLRSIMAGIKFDIVILEDFFLREQGKYMMRLLPVGNGEFLLIGTPYELESSEEEWKQFFEKQKIYSGKDFDPQRYQQFMKKGKFPGYWFEYIQTAACHHQTPILLKGTPN